MFECGRRRSQGYADQVRHDGAGGGHLSRAASIKERMAQRVAIDADGVEAAADFGQHVILMDKRRMHAQRQPSVRAALADCQQLDDVIQVPGEFDIGRLNPLNPLDMNVRF